MKYIVLQVSQKAIRKEYPIIFPNDLVHATVAESMMRALAKEYPKAKIKVVSAGEFSSLDLTPNCHGRSETLNLKSRATDSRLITTYDYEHGLL